MPRRSTYHHPDDVSESDETPITFLSAMHKVQRMQVKQRSKRGLQVGRKSMIIGLKKNQLETLDRMSQSERVPLKSADDRNMVYDRRLQDSGGFGDISCAEIAEEDAYNGEEEEIKEMTTKEALIDMVFGKHVSVLLLATPFACWANFYHWSPAWIFWLNFLVMVPLASILGDFTEELALHTNQTIGGLINATFGNAVEVVVAVQALLADEIRVVQASMLGSIFSNLLLVLGCCFFFGGLYYKEQSFNSVAATSNMGLLALSSIALVLPTPFAEYYNIRDEHVLVVSRISAIFLMFMYLQLLFFQLHTHTHIFEEGPSDDDEEEEEEEEEEIARVSALVATGGLLVATLLVAFFSEYLVDSIDGYCSSSGVSRTFVGLIILPIVGNAVEHITAVNVAMKDKMDLSMGGMLLHLICLTVV
jgi:Ca2+:H+ antiporter